jgi:phage terminase large subunit-like protein
VGPVRLEGRRRPLRRLLRVQTHLLENPRNGGVMRALSADAALQHGLNPSANIIDELHARRDGALYTALTTGTLAREQPFTLWITTAGARDSFLGEM